MFRIKSIFILLCLIPSKGCEQQKPQPERGSVEFYEQDPSNVGWHCISKKRGSTPICWNEGDWAAFCKRVQCK